MLGIKQVRFDEGMVETGLEVTALEDSIEMRLPTDALLRFRKRIETNLQ